MSTIVRLEGVGKRYRRGRERLNLRAALPGRLGESTKGDAHWSLRDLSLTLDAGRSIGIIGPNGAGKSTTLKIVAGVIEPTAGIVEVHGRSASLIELGAGFHPDMTGRENVYFSGAVLGMAPKALRSRFEEIVDFADIGEYLDTPVKRYSSGMLARLGFAVASFLEAELVVLDEVLAVGDASFQRKCHERIAHLRAQGVAMLYVTHALWTLPMLCDEAILLIDGRVETAGDPMDVIGAYEKNPELIGHTKVQTESSVLRGVTGSARAIDPCGSYGVDIELELKHGYPEAHILVLLSGPNDETYAAVSSRAAGIDFAQPGTYKLTCQLASVPLQPGQYRVNIAFFGDHRFPAIDDFRRLALDVRGDEPEPGYGATRVDAAWESTRR